MELTTIMLVLMVLGAKGNPIPPEGTPTTPESTTKPIGGRLVDSPCFDDGVVEAQSYVPYVSPLIDLRLKYIDGKVQKFEDVYADRLGSNRTVGLLKSIPREQLDLITPPRNESDFQTAQNSTAFPKSSTKGNSIPPEGTPTTPESTTKPIGGRLVDSPCFDDGVVEAQSYVPYVSPLIDLRLKYIDGKREPVLRTVKLWLIMYAQHMEYVGRDEAWLVQQQYVTEADALTANADDVIRDLSLLICEVHLHIFANNFTDIAAIYGPVQSMTYLSGLESAHIYMRDFVIAYDFRLFISFATEFFRNWRNEINSSG